MLHSDTAFRLSSRLRGILCLRHSQVCLYTVLSYTTIRDTTQQDGAVVLELGYLANWAGQQDDSRTSIAVSELAAQHYKGRGRTQASQF